MFFVCLNFFINTIGNITLQDTIKEKAEKLYNGPFETLNQLKRKTSDIFYLKFIWTEILKTIDNEYPNIVGINGGIK